MTEELLDKLSQIINDIEEIVEKIDPSIEANDPITIYLLSTSLSHCQEVYEKYNI